MKFDNNEICSIFPIDSLVFYVWDKNFDFSRKTYLFWADILYVQEFFFLCVNEKLQRNPPVRNGLIFFIFQLYGFDHLGFLTNARRGLLQGPRVMDWTTKSPILGNHWVLLGCRALLGSVNWSHLV